MLPEIMRLFILTKDKEIVKKPFHLPDHNFSSRRWVVTGNLTIHNGSTLHDNTQNKTVSLPGRTIFVHRRLPILPNCTKKQKQTTRDDEVFRQFGIIIASYSLIITGPINSTKIIFPSLGRTLLEMNTTKLDA